jgi:hypothetical protein
VKRLLAISWEMPPLSGPRAVQVTRTLVALAGLGWQSRVICFGAQSQRYQQDYDVSLEQLSGGAASRLPVASPEEWLFFRALWRVAPFLKQFPDEKRVWVPSAIAEGRRALADAPADVIVSFAQPWSDHLVGLRLHHESGLPWVAHFSDPWVDNPYHPPPAWSQERIAEMERQVVRFATRVVFVNDYTRDRVMVKYPAEWRNRTHVIPQGHAGPSPALARPDGPLRLVYTGRFYDGVRAPGVFLEAVADLHRASALDGRIAIEFVGGRMDAYAQQASNLGLGSIVQFRARVSPDQAHILAASADVLLVIDAPSEGPSLFLPSKLIDYLPLEKPILGITPLMGPSGDLIRELGYHVIDPRDRAGIVLALRQLLDAHHSGSLTMSPQHPAIAAAYDMRAIGAAFDQVLSTAVAPA